MGAALTLPGAAALADPVRMSLRAQVPAPGKPVLTITADEPISDLRVALQAEPPSQDGAPSGEKGLSQFHESQLDAGNKAVFNLGTGRVGATHWRGMISCRSGGKLWKRAANFDTVVSRPLQIRFDPNYYSGHLDLARHFVEVQLSQPAGRAEIQVYADDGSELGRGAVSFRGEAPGTWLRIPWQSSDSRDALRLAISLYDQSGALGKIDLYPWAVSVPHQEVNFSTASWDIAAGERGKLDDSYRKINDLLDRVEKTLLGFAERGVAASTPPTPKLYVAGHTDTVGPDGDNLTLSRNRARAIAAYFRSQGIRLPIYFAGFGEQKLRAKTADNVDDVRNRRADYTLALESPPVIVGVAWQKLP